MTKQLIAIAAAGFVAFAASAAHAETIQLSKYDLTTAAGNEALYSRIVSSARQVCSPALQRVDSDIRAYRRCVDEVVDSTVKKCRLPSLYKLHAAKTGRSTKLAAAD